MPADSTPTNPRDARRGPTMRVVSVNDVYSLENLPRLATLVREAATANAADKFIVVLAGDFLAPSLLSSLDGGRGMVDCMNAVGVTHAILGNHEDDIPPRELHARIAEFNGVWLSTNIRDFDPRLVPFQILEISGGSRSLKVGLVGVVMDDPTIYRAPPFGGATIAPANEAALAEARRLESDEGCAVVIPITHQPIPDDQALARAGHERPFPVIVGGHEHAPFLERVDQTTIVKTGADAIEAAIIDLAWPAQAPLGARDAPSVTVRLAPVAPYAEDASVRAIVERAIAPVLELEAAVLFTPPNGETLSSVGTRNHQTSFGAFVCSRLRDMLGAELCLFNAGGIRASRTYDRHVTFGDIKAEMPFDNEVVVAKIPGSVVAEAVRVSRSHAPLESGGFLQVDDLARFDDAGGVVAGLPLEPDRDYRVALIRELFFGMDHIAPLVAFAKANPDRVPPAGAGREAKVILVEALALSLWHKLGGFDRVDANHDGYVSEDEIAAAVERETHELTSPTTVDIVMHVLDKSHDHRVSHAEADSVERPTGGSNSAPPSA